MPATQAVEFDPGFRAYEVVREADGAFSVAVTAPDGGTWYRNDVVAFDGRCARDGHGCFLMDMDGAFYAIRIVTKEPHTSRIRKWTGSHIGRYLAIMVDDEVVTLERIETSFGGIFIFGEFETRERVEEICSRVDHANRR